MDAVVSAVADGISAVYGTVTVLIVVEALLGAFGVRQRPLRGRKQLVALLWAACFFFAQQLIRALYGANYGYDGITYQVDLVLYLAATVLFALLFVAGGVTERLALVVSCLFAIMSMRGAVRILFSLLNDYLAFLGDGETILFYLVLYAIQILMALLFIKYPVRPAPSLGASARYLLLGIPTCVAIIAQSQIIAGLNDSTVGSISGLLFQVLAVVAMLASYYLTALVTRTCEQLLEEQQVNQRLELSLDHVQRSGAIVEQVRQDKHELKNLFLYMQALYNDGRYDELGEFLNEQMPQHFDELSEFHTGNNTLDYLLTQKASEARQAGVKVCSEVLVPEDMGISDRDLCGLLGNLLDNAIDASRKEVEAGRDAEVRLSIQAVRGFLLIKIKNRSSEDVLAKNPGLRTTKANAGEHGIGLKVITSLVKEHDGSFATTMEDGYFVATALLAM